MLGVLLPVLMFVGCLFLWIGVPIGWLWIGSQIEAASSLGTAMAAAMVGSITTIIGLAWGLSWLNRKHLESRGEGESSGGVLEPMIVSSAALAAVLFAVWFLFFAGSSPVPLNLGY